MVGAAVSRYRIKGNKKAAMERMSTALRRGCKWVKTIFLANAYSRMGIIITPYAIAANALAKPPKVNNPFGLRSNLLLDFGHGLSGTGTQADPCAEIVGYLSDYRPLHAPEERIIMRIGTATTYILC